MKRCLIVFAREPKKGRVKTRLKGALSETGCLNLYKAFLRDTVNLAQKVKAEEHVIAYDSIDGAIPYLRRVACAFNFYRQEGKDLGQRMHNAFNYARAIKADKSVIIGSDSPELPFNLIRTAFQKLGKYDLVLGPSVDGGYYLIGLKYPCGALFRGVRWSSGDVLSSTLKKARALRMKYFLLDTWYDVDDAGSLARLESDLRRDKNKKIAQYTREVLNA